ncbi:DUF1801 domain-containing protein [Kitasatospora sp. DSM 101779]|uniref:DUF1801 domain-containing protein n=1 Tax=Kitasatospora sp. DSM 101779 TaxID=2853165 RepID=UPI0021DA6935|nr:DUF1801 domain-containing protein [Kitasatospora sp. DSM 101779]MCU7820496.1 DUF1801 domain-containing protein [Kitasatospora sp. DSM 101779]
MGEPKTARTGADPGEFLAGVGDERRRADAQELCALVAGATGAQAEMWGGSMVGFGSYRYRYASGRSGEWPPIAFAPRRQALVLYVAEGFEPYADLLARLGPHTTGKGCLYLKRLADVDREVLTELVATSFARMDGRTIEP